MYVFRGLYNIWLGMAFFAELLCATVCRYKNYLALISICYFMTFGSTLTAGTLHVTLPHVGYERNPGKGTPYRKRVFC